MALKRKDYTCRNIVSSYTIRNVIKQVQPELSMKTVNEYCNLGIADWQDVRGRKFKRKVHAEIYIDIDVFINNLRHSFVRPYNIYLDAVSECSNHNLRPIISFGANVL